MVRAEMGSILKEEEQQFEGEINDSEVKEYKEQCYKLFKQGDYNVRSSNGGFRCLFCAIKDEDDYNYTHLLQHAIHTAEASSSSTCGERHRAKHSAMARYLAVDLANEVNPSEGVKPSSDSDEEPIVKRFRSATPTSKSNCRSSKAARTPPTVNARKVAMAEKREKEALNKVGELERKINEMKDEMNALITKERKINDELQRTSRELIKEKDLNNKLNNSRGIGIKRIGEIDLNIFRRASLKRFPAEDAEIKGFELYSLWQTKLESSWYNFRTLANNKWVVNEKDASLCRLKAELGDEAHNAVVTCIKELIEYQSGGPKNYGLWNFEENRKAKLEEVISWLRSGRREQVELKYVLVSIK